jgi:hypothetical protein
MTTAKFKPFVFPVSDFALSNIANMTNVPNPEFQKLWPNLIEFLRLEYENTIQPYTDAVTLTVLLFTFVWPLLLTALNSVFALYT